MGSTYKPVAASKYNSGAICSAKPKEMLLLKRYLQRLLNLPAKQCSLAALLALFIAAVACLIKWVVVPAVVQKVVWNTMSLKDETTGYQVWLSPPVPVYHGEIVH